ncbi:HAD family hydrolase [Candidatus Aenigmatarchaeota archaeon]
MIKEFVFDFGGVLVFSNLEEFIKEISSQYKISSDIFRQVELENRLKLDAGLITINQYFDSMEKKLNIQIDRKKYPELILKYATLNKELINIVKKLKKHYRLFMLTNNSPLGEKYIKENTEFEQIFDKIIISYHEKMKKPDPEFYKKVIEGTDIKFNECVYLDDREDLVEAGRKLGMKSIVYTTVQDFIEKITSFGVKL